MYIINNDQTWFDNPGASIPTAEKVTEMFVSLCGEKDNQLGGERLKNEDNLLRKTKRNKIVSERSQKRSVTFCLPGLAFGLAGLDALFSVHRFGPQLSLLTSNG